MEEPQASLLQLINKEEDSNPDEFYEDIEAPKFVDFTVPDRDRFRPDDRYWFCSRVGCDQKHEEELDSEAIYKNFVLRVMAARSPNVRLRKTLNRKCSSATVKCPQSAPAKSSKSRVSRLAVISSISHKLSDAKVKVRPIAKAISTPTAKAKQSSVASKALTTPRNKKCILNPNSFRSVQNPKATTIAVPKNKLIAKALVFSSPKKVRTKLLLGVDTPVRKVCEGMKKLEITSQSKRILGYSLTTSKGLRRDINKPLPSEASSKQLSARKVKSQAVTSVHSRKYMDRKDKSSRGLKEKRKEENLEKCHDFVQPEGVENDSSDMKLDGKSRNGSLVVHSLLVSSKNNGGNGHEELSASEKILGNLDSTSPAQEKGFPCLERPPSEENSNAGLPNASRGEIDPIENSGVNVQTLTEEDNTSSERIEQEEKIKSSLKKGEVFEDETSERQTSEGGGHDTETLDSDDKENASASNDDNRDLNPNTDLTGRKLFGRHETCENNQKIARALNKTLEKGLTSTIKGGQGVKYKKPKPTNPKPFRLRTDERGILKEANMEKRLHLLEPPKETATLPMANSHKRHENDTNEGRKEDLQITTQKNQLQEIRTVRMMANKKEVERKTRRIRQTVLTNQKPKVGSSSPSEGVKDRVVQKVEKGPRKTKSYLLQQQVVRPQVVRPQGANSTRKAVVSLRKPGQLSVIEETSSKLSRPKEAGKPSESFAIAVAKGSFSTPSRPLSRGRRPTTIPREPNFHSIHTPKSCTRQLV